MPVHHLPGGTRGTRTSEAPEVARAIIFFRYYRRWALARTVRIPHGVRTDQLGCYPFLLEQQLRAQYSLAYLLFCVGIWVGSLRYIPVGTYMYS